jgi:hypothetical protein
MKLALLLSLVAAGQPSYRETLDWLDAQVAKHGQVLLEPGAGPSTTLVTRLDSRHHPRCEFHLSFETYGGDLPVPPRMLVPMRAVSRDSIRTEPWDGLRVRSRSSGAPGVCVRMDAAHNALRVRPSSLHPQRNASTVTLCLDDESVGPRVVKALRHLATLCGAPRTRPKEPF